MSIASLKTTLASAFFGRPDASLEERNLRNIILSGAFVGFIDGGIVVFLPVYLARLGASPAIMGLLAAGPALINMLLYLPGGAFVERQRDLIKLVNWAVFLHRSGYLVIALLPFMLMDSQIPLVAAVLWSLINVSTCFFWPALLVVMQRAVSPKLRPRATGGRWAAMTVVAAVLIPILGYVLDHMRFPTGYQLAFVVSFVGAIPNVYFFARVRVPPQARPPSDGEQRPLGERLRAYLAPFLAHKGFVRFNLATALVRICLSLPAGLFSLFWVQELHASDTWIGLRGMVGYGALALGYWGWGRVAHRMGHRRLLVLTGIMLGFYPIITGMSQSVEWLLPAALVWGISAAGIDIGLVDMLLLNIPEARKPSFVAIANMLASAETVAGPLIGAALAPLLGIKLALLLSGVLVIASVAFFMLLPSREMEYRIHADQAQPVQTQPDAAA